MGLFSKKNAADGTQEKGRHLGRFFRHSAKHDDDSERKTATTTHREPSGSAANEITEPVADKNPHGRERRDDVVLTSGATANAERATSDELPTTVEPTKEIAPPQVDILAKALGQLPKQDRDAITPYLSGKDSNVVGILDGSLAAVQDQKRVCDNKRWTLTFRGHTIIVKEKVDTIVRWIGHFKDVGDLVAGLDPIHAGLPWAGFKLLLEASVAEADQMAALLVGCETALYMANRLKVYVSFLSNVPPGQSRTNLEEALVKMYSRILVFLAQALQIYQRSTWKRSFTAFWQPKDVNEFEHNCQALGHELEVEASNADRTVSEHGREVLRDVHLKMKNALKELERLRTIQESLDRIEKKMDLANLQTVKGALFDSFGQVHECHPATRQDVLDKIRAWAQDPDGKRIFWLAGMAGTGKSTISATVCRWLKKKGVRGIVDLGGSFFFKRGEGDRGSAALLIPTIVGELVRKIPGLDVFVAEALDTDICSKALPEQFKRLISEPLQKVALDAQRRTLVVVIDALDECANVSDIRTVLTLWQDLPHVQTMSLRLFVTTRPEVSVGVLKPAAHRQVDIELQKVSDDIVRNDIFIYLRDRLAEFRDEHNADPPGGVCLPDDWPTNSTLSDIVNIAVPLFIVAATIYKFLVDKNYDPNEQLQRVLSQPRGGQMAQTYMPVLNRFASGVTDSAERKQLCDDFSTIVGAIICLGEPLSRPALADLLGMKASLVTRRLHNLRSVLQIPEDTEMPVRPLHLSFGEFLTSEKCEDQAFRVNAQATHLMLWQRCLQLLSEDKGLREDICGLKHPGHLRGDLPPDLVDQHLRPALQYACRYWIYHVQSSMFVLSNGDEVHTFLQRHFLHWLEALSLLGRLADAIELISILQSRVRPDNSGQIAAFLEDAWRFVLANRFVAELAPLQLYSSALAFAPQGSIVRDQCGPPAAWIEQGPITPPTWGLELQKLEGHTKPVAAVSFSPDGSLLASASSDNTVRLWRVSTGQEL